MAAALLLAALTWRVQAAGGSLASDLYWADLMQALRCVRLFALMQTLHALRCKLVASRHRAAGGGSGLRDLPPHGEDFVVPGGRAAKERPAIAAAAAAGQARALWPQPRRHGEFLRH